MKLGQTKEYRAWIDMRRRCNNPNRYGYRNYGGRGISVCERWSSFADFIADVGYAPHKTAVLDRTNNDGNYEPGNVQWVSPEDSTNNRRVSLSVQVDGVKTTLAKAARLLGCSSGTLRYRMYKGETPDTAGRKARVYGQKYTYDGQTLSALEWAKHTGIPVSTIKYRLRIGATIEEALKH